MRALRPWLLPATWRGRLALGVLLIVALVLRLAVWRWHRLYPLGGDEREYFSQALTWLQGKGYHDLPLMRPPLYPAFLAVVFQLFDSQVQRVRLVQALISTGGVYLQWLFVRLALPQHNERAPLLAAALVAVSFTLAANATELLTETTFVVGLLVVLSLLVAARTLPVLAVGSGGGYCTRIAGAGALGRAAAAAIGCAVVVDVRAVRRTGTAWVAARSIPARPGAAVHGSNTGGHIAMDGTQLCGVWTFDLDRHHGRGKPVAGQ